MVPVDPHEEVRRRSAALTAGYRWLFGGPSRPLGSVPAAGDPVPGDRDPGGGCWTPAGGGAPWPGMEPTTPAVHDATDETFDSLVAPEGITVIDFWAAWCGPCRAFAPVFARSAQANPSVVHLKVDVDANPRLAAAFAIRSIPTLVFLRDGQGIATHVGAMGDDALRTAIAAI